MSVGQLIRVGGNINFFAYNQGKSIIKSMYILPDRDSLEKSILLRFVRI